MSLRKPIGALSLAKFQLKSYKDLTYKKAKTWRLVNVSWIRILCNIYFLLLHGSRISSSYNCHIHWQSWLSRTLAKTNTHMCWMILVWMKHTPMCVHLCVRSTTDISHMFGCLGHSIDPDHDQWWHLCAYWCPSAGKIPLRFYLLDFFQFCRQSETRFSCWPMSAHPSSPAVTAWSCFLIAFATGTIFHLQAPHIRHVSTGQWCPGRITTVSKALIIFLSSLSGWINSTHPNQTSTYIFIS